MIRRNPFLTSSNNFSVSFSSFAIISSTINFFFGCHHHHCHFTNRIFDFRFMKWKKKIFDDFLLDNNHQKYFAFPTQFSFFPFFGSLILAFVCFLLLKIQRNASQHVNNWNVFFFSHFFYFIYFAWFHPAQQFFFSTSFSS